MLRPLERGPQWLKEIGGEHRVAGPPWRRESGEACEMAMHTHTPHQASFFRKTVAQEIRPKFPLQEKWIDFRPIA